MIILPIAAKFAIQTLLVNGYEAYVVGGCIRDLGLGKIPNDIDITTNATPDEVFGCFLNYKIIDTGKKHGTLTVIIKGVSVEITTFRIDGEYKNLRQPQNVIFTNSLEKDLSRRDFTFNALCYNDNSGLIDMFGGVDDIENHIIRTIGEPQKRFSEDALRILRGFRFMSQLGFRFTPECIDAIKKNKNGLSKIAQPRLMSELSKLLVGDFASETILLMTNLSVLDDYFPIKNDPFIKYLGKSKPILSIRLAITFTNPFFDVDAVIKQLKNLCFDKKIMNETLFFLQNKDINLSDNIVFIKTMLGKFGCNQLIFLLEYLETIRSDDLLLIKKIREKVDLIIKKQECFLASDLKINGDMLYNIGIVDGKEIGDTLKYLLKKVYENNSLNKRKILLSLAQEYKKNF